MPKKAAKQSAMGTPSAFAQRVADARRACDLTQGELAEKAGVHISHIQRIEAGTSQPTVDILKRIAETLLVSIDFLVLGQASAEAAQIFADRELLEKFVAIEKCTEEDKQAIKTLLTAMILKQRVEAAVR